MGGHRMMTQDSHQKWQSAVNPVETGKKENPSLRRVTPERRVCLLQMVEAAGIEPASEGASTCASTCVACHLRIRRPEAPQAGFSGSLGEISTRLPDVSPASGDEARCRRLSHLADGQW